MCGSPIAIHFLFEKKHEFEKETTCFTLQMLILDVVFRFWLFFFLSFIRIQRFSNRNHRSISYICVVFNFFHAYWITIDVIRHI